MIGALIYLVACSTKNALLARLRRLKQPKYFFGGIVGGFYLYFVYFRNLVFSRYSRGHGGFSAAHFSPELATVIEFAGAALLLMMVTLKWMLPEKRAALEFTEAEIAFLFPAPVSRRMLVQYKLVRSQMGILFGALLMTVFSGRIRSGTAMISMAAWWLAFSTLNFHFIAASFTHSRLLDRGISTRRRQMVAGAIVGSVAILIGVWVWFFVPRPTLDTVSSLKGLATYLEGTFFTGPMFFVSYPFRLLVRPFVAPDFASLIVAAIPVISLLILHYLWIIRSDVAFEEASLAAAQKRAELIAAVKAGHMQIGSKKRRRRTPFFRLAPAGFEPVAILWKNLISADQMFSRRLWLMVAIIGISLSSVFSSTGSGGEIGVVIGGLALGFIGTSLLFGPQILRQDLRQDLAVVDVLKLYPLPGWKIVLGELLAPAVLLTAFQWFLLVIAVITFQFHTRSQLEPFPLTTRIAVGSAIGILLPFLNIFSLVIVNAATLAFPAWVQLGPTAQRGFEVMGQHLIGVLGQILATLLALIPVCLVTGGIVFVGNTLGFFLLSLPVGAIAGALILATEAGAAIYFLGKLFDRFDLSSEPPV